MSEEVLSRLAKHIRDRHLFFDRGHVARLAAFFFSKGAMAPFQIGHLFGQAADHLALRSSRLRVERVASCAEFRLLDVRRLGGFEASGGPHDRRMSGIDLESAIYRPLGSLRHIDHVSTGEAIGCAEFLIRDLMANRAGHAVGRKASAGRGTLAYGQMREHGAPSTGSPRLCCRHRHMTDRLRSRPSSPGGPEPRGARWPASTDRARSSP